MQLPDYYVRTEGLRYPCSMPLSHGPATDGLRIHGRFFVLVNGEHVQERALDHLCNWLRIPGVPYNTVSRSAASRSRCAQRTL